MQRDNKKKKDEENKMEWNSVYILRYMGILYVMT